MPIMSSRSVAPPSGPPRPMGLPTMGRSRARHHGAETAVPDGSVPYSGFALPGLVPGEDSDHSCPNGSRNRP